MPVLREMGRPSVLIGFPADVAGLTCIDLDFSRAGAVCVEHLAALGHRSIALLGAAAVVYERDTSFARCTMAGFTETARARGIEAVAQPCEEHFEGVRAQLAALFARQPGLTGLVEHNEAALGDVLAALRSLGRRVPDDVSVVAICSDELAERARPALDSVLVPAEEVGEQAVSLLMRKLVDEPVPEATLLDPRLTVRASSAAPRPGSPLTTAAKGTRP